VRSAAQAKEWLELLQATLRRLEVSDVRMEEGSLRCDANVSIRPAGEASLGTKTELKNMNSFRFLERGVNAEITRQEEIVRSGGEVVQETLHYDPATGALSPLRSKEEAHDYRYLPEPDLVPLAPTEEMLARARAALPELPAGRAERLERELGLPPDVAKLLAFRTELGDFYEATVSAGGPEGDPRAIANWVTGELLARLGDADPDPDFRAAFERVDLIVTPTSPTVAFGLGERTEDPLAMYLSDALTVPMPLAGLPAISIPTGMSDGLPVGFQIAGPAFSENRILEAAHAIERAVGFDGAPPRG
jgi:Asp-tRNA(Asn)/Glu-tRNA(Gln) amidotransferase B subunit